MGDILARYGRDRERLVIDTLIIVNLAMKISHFRMHLVREVRLNSFWCLHINSLGYKG